MSSKTNYNKEDRNVSPISKLVSDIVDETSVGLLELVTCVSTEWIE